MKGIVDIKERSQNLWTHQCPLCACFGLSLWVCSLGGSDVALDFTLRPQNFTTWKKKKKNQGAHPYNTAQATSHALKYLVDAKPGECG